MLPLRHKTEKAAATVNWGTIKSATIKRQLSINHQSVIQTANQIILENSYPQHNSLTSPHYYL